MYQVAQHQWKIPRTISGKGGITQSRPHRYSIAPTWTEIEADLEDKKEKKKKTGAK